MLRALSRMLRAPRVRLNFVSHNSLLGIVLLIGIGFPSISLAACTWGNCENGVGRFEYESGNYNIAQYKDGRRDGYGIWRKADETSECEGTNRLGKRDGLWICRSLLSTRNSYITSFTYYAEGKNQYASDTALYLNDAGRVVRYVSATGNPSQDYDRFAEDYSALTDISLGQLRLNLSKEFRQIAFPTKESLISYLGRSASNDNSESANASETLPQPSAAKETEAETKTEPVGCKFGDCKGGFGSYRFDNGDEHTGYFKNSYENGYGIFVRPLQSGEQRECEGLYSNGYKSGLRVCRRSDTSVATAYYYSNKGKANGRGVSWNSDSGEIVSLGLWRDDKFIREEAADLTKMSADWEGIKASPQALMRASFLSDEFLALKLPTADEQSDWLRERELARAKKTQSIPKEKPIRLGCISGDCDDGFGEFATSRVTYAGRFKSGRASGYTLVTSSKEQCEAQMSGGLHAGVEHCVNLETGNHTYAYRSRAGYDGAKITIAQTGKLVAYEVFEEGSEVDVSFSSEADKEKLASLELRGLLDELDTFKRTAPPESRSLRVAPLNRLPKVEFGPREPVKPQRPKPQIQPKPAQETRPISEPKPIPAPKKAPKPVPAIEPKPASKPLTAIEPTPAPVPEQAIKAPRAAPAPKPTASAVVTPTEPKKPPRDLQRLAYIVAELNSNRRQINYNYRLDRVRIDSKKFELVYEFFATKPIKELNTSVIARANKTAYCSSAKLQPFRDENMPARWSYVDSEEEAFEVVTKVSDCR